MSSVEKRISSPPPADIGRSLTEPLEPKPARAEFNERYYRCVFQDFRREIEAGLPFLRSFKSGPAWHLADMMSGMPRDKQLLLAAALGKRFHKDAAEATGDQISAV